MTGIEFLAQAIELQPDAKRVLLTAYADTDVAIRAINEIRLDHYILKPWDPPEEHLYPVLDDLLADWTSTFRPSFEGLRLLAGRWAPGGHLIRDYLTRNQVPYQWLDPKEDEEGRRLAATCGGARSRSSRPCRSSSSRTAAPCAIRSTRDIAERVGLQTRAALPFYDLVIVGGGPAGLAAAVYGASEGLKTILIEREAPGGQAGTTSRIENYLGFPAGLTGGDLARRALAQARRLGAEILSPDGRDRHPARRPVSRRHPRRRPESQLPDGRGRHRRQLPAARAAAAPPSWPAPAIYYGAATTEAVLYRDADVGVMGGGNSAGQAAVYLSRYAKRVMLMVRGPEPSGMSQYLIDQMAAIENIEVRLELLDYRGARRDPPDRRHLDRPGGTEELDAAALFIFIGQQPRTEWLEGTVERDPGGFVLTGRTCSRSESGRTPLAGAWPASHSCSSRACRASSWPATCDIGPSSASPARWARAPWPSSSCTSTWRPSRPAGPMTVEALRAAPLFTGLSDADLERLAATVERQKLAPGELLLREGDPGDAMFVVVSGELEVTKRAGATEQPLARVGPGAIQGEIAALQGTERQASVRAVTDVEVLRIPRGGPLACWTPAPMRPWRWYAPCFERLRSLELFVRQREKLAGLGTLAAGLAHELNNPAAAIRRSVHLLGEAMAERDKLHPPHDLLGIEPNPDLVPTDPLARADAVDELLELVGDSEEAAALVDAGWSVDQLRSAFAGMDPETARDSGMWLAASAKIDALLGEVAMAGERISEIVGAVKSYTYLDQAPVQRIDVRKGLDDTLVILRSKLRAGVDVTRHYAPNLPEIEAYGSELNQVWTNLVDNATDAMDGRGAIDIHADPAMRRRPGPHL